MPRLNREESQARTRSLLIEAARREIVKKGFALASVRDIADAAGFSQGAFYSNFPDKEAILLGLAMPRTTKLNTLSAEIADDFKFAVDVNPSLKKALNDKMETGLKAARDTARAKLALTSGEEDDV